MKGLPLLALLAACGGKGPVCGPGSFSGPPLLTVTSDSGALQLAVRTSPQPPIRDCNDAQYTVTDKNGAPVTGLSVAVTPWMPDMAHGSSVTPRVTEQGNGVYEVDQLVFSMPGTWQLRTDLSSDHATPDFQIP